MILTKAVGSSQASVALIRSEFAKLDVYMSETAKDNMVEFNIYVCKKVKELRSLDGESTDLITHLLSAYKTIKNDGFKCRIAMIDDRFLGGDDIAVEDLLRRTDQLYLDYSKNRKTWKQASKDEEEIIALCAEIQSLKQSIQPKKGRNHNHPRKKKDGDQVNSPPPTSSQGTPNSRSRIR